MANYSNSQVLDILIIFGECERCAVEMTRMSNDIQIDINIVFVQFYRLYYEQDNCVWYIICKKKPSPRPHYERDNEAM